MHEVSNTTSGHPNELRRLSTKLWSLLILASSTLGYIGAIFLKKLDSISGEALKDVSVAAFGGAIIAILFDWITERDSDIRTRSIVDDSLKRTLQPTISRASDSSLSGYRWYAYVEPPGVSDPFPEYMYVTVRLIYTIPHAPRRMKVICAVSNDGAALREWKLDKERVMQWKMETAASPLDIQSDRVAQVTEFRLDGVPVPLRRDSVKTIPGGVARVFEYDVNKLLHDREVRVSVVIRVRMYCEANGRSVTSTQLYHDVSDAEFTYVVSDQIPLRDLQVVADEVTPVVPAFRPSLEGPVWPGARRQSSFVAFRSPLQAGSALRFEMYRAP